MHVRKLLLKFPQKFLRFSPFNFQVKWPQEVSLKLGRSFLVTGKSFLLTVGLCCLLSIALVFLTCGWNSVCFLLTVENRFGLFYLWLKIGPEIRFGRFCLRLPPSGNLVWSFLLTVFPHNKRRTVSEKTSAVSKTDASKI